MQCSHPNCTKTAVFTIHNFHVCEEHAYSLCICLECGKLEWEENLLWEHGTVSCSACRTTVECEHCGVVMKPRHALTTDDDKKICQKCHDEHYIPCFQCGKPSRKDGSEVSSSDGSNPMKLCKTCSKDSAICSTCFRLVKKSMLTHVEIDGVEHHGCKHCLIVHICAGCGKRYPSTQTPHPNIPKNRLLNNNYCIVCGKDKWAISLGDYRHQRNIDPSKFLPSYNKKGLFFGIEIEQELTVGNEQRDKDIAKLWTSLPELIVDIKRDGSLSNGQEIVTYPATFDYLMATDLSPIIDIPHMIKPVGTGAGFHVHLSRAAFTTTHLYKFCDFMYRYSYLLQLVGGRNFTNYCKKSTNKSWAKAKAKLMGITNHKGTHTRVRITARYGAAPQFDRYDIVNLTETTAEVRSFNTPETLEQLKYRLQFLHAVFEFTKHLKLTDKDLGERFVTYVTDHDKLYPELVEFLKANDRGLTISFSKIAAGLEV